MHGTLNPFAPGQEDWTSYVERLEHYFAARIQAKEESIAAYLAALRELFEYCEYGDTLSEMIRDRLVCGVNHDGIQRRLLAEN